MRLRHVMLWIPLCACLSACASLHDRGWSGEGATPFDTAQATCDAKTRDLPAGEQREDAFDACMQENGWKRP